MKKIVTKECPYFKGCTGSLRQQNKSCFDTDTCNVYKDWFSIINPYDSYYTRKPLDFNLLSQELESKKNIVDKLNHWYENYWKSIYDKFYRDIDNYKKRHEVLGYQNSLLNSEFGTSGGELYIPQPIFKAHFWDDWQTKERLYWNFQFDCKYYFTTVLEIYNWNEKLNSPLAVETIQRELNKINAFEKTANEVYTNGDIDIYHDRVDYTNRKYHDVIYYLRIKANYYEKHSLPSYYIDIRNICITHNYLKPYLEDKLLEVQQKQLSSNLNQKSILFSKEADKIEQERKKENLEFALSEIGFMKGKAVDGKRIMSEQSFNKLLLYVTELVNNEKLPSNIEPIPKTNLSQMMIRYTFYKIHKELYTTKSIREYFIEFLHTVFFKQFENTTKTTTGKKFSKKPNMYDNDMQIMTRKNIGD